VADQHDRGVFRVDDQLRRGGVTGQRQGRVLDRADAVAVGLEQVVDPLPAGSVDESAVHEHDGGLR